MAIDLRLAVTDLPVGDLPLKIKCPDTIHRERLGKSDRTSSLAVYPDHLHCYGCGFHLDWWPEDKTHSLAYIHPLSVLLSLSYEEARARESHYTSEAVDAYRERVAVESEAAPLHPALAAIYHEMLTNGPRSHRMDYLFDRGLDRETIDLAKLGHDGQRFTIPVFDDKENLLTFRYRRDDEYLDEKYPKYSGMKGRNGFFLYPLPIFLEWYAEHPSGDTAWLCEGEFDALILNQFVPALTATNGAGQVHKIPAIIAEKWPRITKLFIATDQDEAGEEAARLTILAATELGFETERLRWPDAKDVTDAWKLGVLPLG